MGRAPGFRSTLLCILLPFLNRYRLDDPFGLGPAQIDMEKTVLQERAPHLDAIGQHKAPLELSGRDATVQKHTLIFYVGLPTTDHKGAVLNCDRKFLLGETSHGQRDPVPRWAGLFNVVRWIAVSFAFGRALNKALELLKAQKEGV